MASWLAQHDANIHPRIKPRRVGINTCATELAALTPQPIWAWDGKAVNSVDPCSTSLDNDEPLPLPHALHPAMHSEFVSLSADRLTVTYTGSACHADDVGVAFGDAAVRSPSINSTPFYFEVTLMALGDEDISDRCSASIGLSMAHTSLNTQPGTNEFSFAMLLSSARLLCGNIMGREYGGDYMEQRMGTRATVGDVFGCGVDFAHRQVFFTKNGTHLGIALPNFVCPRPFYPVVSVHSAGEELRVNFGDGAIDSNVGAVEAFKFDIVAFQRSQEEMLKKEIAGVAGQSVDTTALVEEYLLLHGLDRTLAALRKAQKEEVTKLSGKNNINSVEVSNSVSNSASTNNSTNIGSGGSGSTESIPETDNGGDDVDESNMKGNRKDSTQTGNCVADSISASSTTVGGIDRNSTTKGAGANTSMPTFVDCGAVGAGGCSTDSISTSSIINMDITANTYQNIHKDKVHDETQNWVLSVRQLARQHIMSGAPLEALKEIKNGFESLPRLVNSCRVLLMQQQFVELVSSQRETEALIYARGAVENKQISLDEISQVTSIMLGLQHHERVENEEVENEKVEMDMKEIGGEVSKLEEQRRQLFLQVQTILIDSVQQHHRPQRQQQQRQRSFDNGVFHPVISNKRIKLPRGKDVIIAGDVLGNQGPHIDNVEGLGVRKGLHRSQLEVLFAHLLEVTQEFKTKSFGKALEHTDGITDIQRLLDCELSVSRK